MTTRKTPGQVLYEYRHPATILVVPYARRKFATRADAFEAPNPACPAPWHLLTPAVRESYEREAGLHWYTQKVSAS